MRCVVEDHDLLLYDRPYAGALGVSLYAAAVDPDADPGPRAIEFRRNRILDSADQCLAGVSGVYNLGETTVPKSPRLTDVTQPTGEIRYAIPAAWQEKTVWAQVRTHAADYENETIYRPRRLMLGDDGEDVTPVFGTATVIALEKRDGGGLRLRFSWNQPRDGLTPTQFVLGKVTGSGTIMPGTVPYYEAQRVYEIDVTGLSNGVAYTFKLWAETSTVSTDLITGIAFTGDTQGPPAVTAHYEEW